MPRSLNDWLLLAGAVIAVLICGILAYHNTIPNKQGQLLLGTAIAFACALIAVGTDLHDSVTGRLGNLANTSILQTWQGWASLVAWGAFTAAMFHIVLINPTWASETFHFTVDNNLAWTGVAVGISAIIIIRSKLAKVGNVEWGVEWIYLWSSAQVLDAVNQRRITTKNHWDGKFRPSANDIAKHPNFFTDLETHMISILNGKSPKVQTALTQEFQRIRATLVPAGAANPNAAMNGSAPARRYLVSAILDHLGHTELVAWAKIQGITI